MGKKKLLMANQMEANMDISPVEHQMEKNIKTTSIEHQRQEHMVATMLANQKKSNKGILVTPTPNIRTL